MDRDWSYMHQVERARDKGIQLLKAGCTFSEFGSRRRRDYHTHDLILQGLRQAADDGKHNGWSGKLTGSSNVHMAMKHGLAPVGTVAHEWFMSVAAITGDYEHANEIGLRYWVGTFGPGVLGIALTDTFGTENFLKAFAKPAELTSGAPAAAANTGTDEERTKTYAEVFTGTRQDSGDPEDFIKLIAKFYKEQGITEKKTVVFSDSLNIEKCLQYSAHAVEAGLIPSFGVGTFFTSKFYELYVLREKLTCTDDYINTATGEKSIPLNIVIKVASCDGKPAVKISDNIGKNTGDKATVEEVKQRLGYTEKSWKEGDEKHRWG
jgi:nicotinate phosphoribosyltransferase